MASIYGAKSSTGWQLRLDYTYTQDIKANSSNISMSLYIYDATGESYNQAANSCYYVLQGKKVYHPYSYSSKGWYKLGSDTLTVMHDSDGTKSVRLYGSWYSGFTSSYTPSSLSVADTITLKPIPRASSVSCTTANIGSDAIITISKASSNFTHTLTYSFGSLHGTIVTKTSSTNISWTIPTTFYAQIPNAQSGWGTITCDTYNGSTLVGTSTCTFTARCDESQCKPTISGSVSDSDTTTVALTGSNQKFVKYYSNASVTSDASARNGATLKSQKVTCGSKSISTANGTISGVDSGTFVLSATDSRGFTTSQTLNKTLVDYVKLTCAMHAGASSTSGVAQLQVSGNYWDGNFGVVANTLTIQYRYKVNNEAYGAWTNSTDSITKNNNTYSTTVSISGLNYLNAYTFQVRAIDKLATVTSEEQTRKTIPIFDWGKDDFNVNGTLKLNNTNIFDLIYPVGAIYISVNATSPETLFGGTWEQLHDVFLLASSSSHALGSTGGEATHTLTRNEIPDHTHSFKYTGQSVTTGVNSIRLYQSAPNQYNAYSGGQSSNCGGQAHNNMPPYMAVNMWKRTA